uniref:Uncharacterized protein n=1 Tax=Anopheles coluzzii TaxID=1518534 RepID=A0A8W7P899_ANOCL
MTQMVFINAVMVVFVLDMFVLVMVVHWDMDRDLDRVRHWLLDLIRDVLLDGVRHWTLNRNLHRVGHVLLDRDRDVLVHWVGLRDWHLHRDWDGLLNVHWHGAIVRDMHWVRDLLDDLIRHWLLHRDRDWLLNMDRDWAIDWHMDWVVDDLLNRVRLLNVHWDLDRVRDLLLNWVRSWDMDLHRDMDLLLDWVGSGHVHLDRDGTIVRNVDWVRDLLLNRVRGWDVHWHLDDLLDRVVDSLVDWVGLRHSNLHRDGHMLLHWHWDVLLHWVRDRDLLDDGQRLLVVRMQIIMVAMGVRFEMMAAEIMSTEVVLEQTTLIVALFALRCWFRFWGRRLLLLLGRRTQDQ